ncbi:hypothetical protein [Rhodanobacter sp. L36]|uniref:hypothetical protein n=1 Tax=Rhodanobacter sp. L36 TaxID=1747221 RepID=UPI00131D1D88|nr:hypothetical protein [Rhodanobacter sp. L36]
MLLMIGWSGASVADDLFGIAMHQPLKLRECAQRQGSYLPDDRSVCFKWPSGPAKTSSSVPDEGTVIVNISINQRPGFMHGADVEVGLRHGVVTSVATKTHGAGQDNQDLAELVQLFGRTDPQRITDGLNPYQSLRANWQLPHGGSVYFNSTEYGRYNGMVKITEP